MIQKRFVKYDGNTIVDLKLVKSWTISNGDVDLLTNLLDNDTSVNPKNVKESLVRIIQELNEVEEQLQKER